MTKTFCDRCGKEIKCTENSARYRQEWESGIKGFRYDFCETCDNAFLRFVRQGKETEEEK